MKKAIYTLVFMFCALFATAQAPQKFNYQAVARNAQGAVLPNQNVKIRVSILDGSASGTSQYSETHSATSSQLGLFNLAIGGGTVVGGNFANITWAIGDKYLKIEMDATGGNNFTLVGTSQLLSVPYALYAASGNPGPKGDKGDTGATGLKGDKGDTGATGLKGDKGDTGATGLKGDKGDTGATGQKGDKGDAGPQGPSGGAETLLRQCVVTGFTGTLNAFITVNTINSMCSAANGNVFYTGLVKTNSGGSI